MRFKRQWGGHLKFDNQVLLQSQVKKWYKGENETHWKRLLYKSDKGIISFTQGGFKMKRTQSAYCSSFVTVMCHWCWTSQTCHYGSTQSFFLPTKSNTHPLFTNCHLGVLWTSHCQSHTKDKWCFIPYFLTGQCMWWNQTVCWKVTESFRGSMDTGKHELLQWASAKQKLLRFDRTTLLTQIHRTASFPFLFTPIPVALYDMIWRLVLYDINLRATHTTIPSTSGVTIYISLVK